MRTLDSGPRGDDRERARRTGASTTAILEAGFQWLPEMKKLVVEADRTLRGEGEAVPWLAQRQSKLVDLRVKYEGPSDETAFLLIIHTG